MQQVHRQRLACLRERKVPTARRVPLRRRIDAWTVARCATRSRARGARQLPLFRARDSDRTQVAWHREHWERHGGKLKQAEKESSMWCGVLKGGSTVYKFGSNGSIRETCSNVCQQCFERRSGGERPVELDRLARAEQLDGEHWLEHKHSHMYEYEYEYEYASVQQRMRWSCKH